MGNEELAAIRTGAGVRHRQHARLMLERVLAEVNFILKLVAGAAAARAGRVAALDDKVVDHGGRRTPSSYPSHTRKTKLLTVLGSMLCGQFNLNQPPRGFHLGDVTVLGVDLHGGRLVPLLGSHSLDSFSPK